MGRRGYKLPELWKGKSKEDMGQTLIKG
ncbi:hypothetical protein A2U01_0088017, partial [Trifolium medium]|nr:hypothetical protein [Trifolium medium]